MNAPSKVLLVVGSPKGKTSASNSMATYFADRLSERGVETEKAFIQDLPLDGSRDQGFLERMAEADSAFFFFPLYADQLPGILIRALESYEAHRSVAGTGRLKSIAALCNSGFPEASQNDAALAVVRRFAEGQGLSFLGGLALGGGGMVRGGVSLEAQGGKMQRLQKVLSLSADAVAQGHPLPEEALRLVRRPILPNFLYGWIAEMGFRWECYKRKVDATARPYDETHEA